MKLYLLWLRMSSTLWALEGIFTEIPEEISGISSRMEDYRWEEITANTTKFDLYRIKTRFDGEVKWINK